MKQLVVPDDTIPGPEFIKFKDDDGKERWTLPEFVTVAQWREAQQAATTGDDKHALRQFRMATIMLELAAQHAVPDDVVLMPSIGVRSDDTTHDFATDAPMAAFGQRRRSPSLRSLLSRWSSNNRAPLWWRGAAPVRFSARAAAQTLGQETRMGGL